MENKIRTIAFPSVSTGVYAYPLQQAARIAITTAKQFLIEHPDAFDTVMWVLFDERTMSAYEQAINEIQE